MRVGCRVAGWWWWWCRPLPVDGAHERVRIGVDPEARRQLVRVGAHRGVSALGEAVRRESESYMRGGKGLLTTCQQIGGGFILDKWEQWRG